MGFCFSFFFFLSYLEQLFKVEKTHLEIGGQRVFLTSLFQRHFTHAGNVLANTDVDTLSLFSSLMARYGGLVCVCVNVLLTSLTHTHTHSKEKRRKVLEDLVKETKCRRRMGGNIHLLSCSCQTRPATKTLSPRPCKHYPPPFST